MTVLRNLKNRLKIEQKPNDDPKSNVSQNHVGFKDPLVECDSAESDHGRTETSIPPSDTAIISIAPNDEGNDASSEKSQKASFIASSATTSTSSSQSSTLSRETVSTHGSDHTLREKASKLVHSIMHTVKRRISFTEPEVVHKERLSQINHFHQVHNTQPVEIHVRHIRKPVSLRISSTDLDSKHSAIIKIDNEKSLPQLPVDALLNLPYDENKTAINQLIGKTLEMNQDHLIHTHKDQIDPDLLVDPEAQEQATALARRLSADFTPHEPVKTVVHHHATYGTLKPIYIEKTTYETHIFPHAELHRHHINITNRIIPHRVVHQY